eukprot:1158714-Pelagomonas_calceolata.AAC.4
MHWAQMCDSLERVQRACVQWHDHDVQEARAQWPSNMSNLAFQADSADWNVADSADWNVADSADWNAAGLKRQDNCTFQQEAKLHEVHDGSSSVPNISSRACDCLHHAPLYSHDEGLETRIELRTSLRTRSPKRSPDKSLNTKRAHTHLRRGVGGNHGHGSDGEAVRPPVPATNEVDLALAIEGCVLETEAWTHCRVSDTSSQPPMNKTHCLQSRQHITPTVDEVHLDLAVQGCALKTKIYGGSVAGSTTHQHVAG